MFRNFIDLRRLFVGQQFAVLNLNGFVLQYFAGRRIDELPAEPVLADFETQRAAVTRVLYGFEVGSEALQVLLQGRHAM